MLNYILKMNKTLFLILGLFMISCNANESFIDINKPKFQNISFDVVQKQLIIQPDLPDHLHNLINQWFDQKVKINGFDGNMIFTVSNFEQNVTPISDGKKVDLSLSFNVFLKKPSFSREKLINGKVSSYGTLTGNFSLSEFDTVIINTQSDLILRLSRDLKSKI